jgi:hypothetical protein
MHGRSSHPRSPISTSLFSATRRLRNGFTADLILASFLIPLADKQYSGVLSLRIPPELHLSLATQAAEQGVSINRLVSARLAVLA